LQSKKSILKEQIAEKACQKMHPDRLKMHQKAFGGGAPPEPAGNT